MTTEPVVPGDYFQAARDILAEHGHPALTIPELCRRLDVSKGSFYHHFENLPAFVTALLEDWENDFTHWWAASDTVWDPVERWNLAMDFLLDENHRLNAALRVWGQIDPRVGRAVAHRDATMLYSHEQTLAMTVADPARRRWLAEVGMSLHAGLQIRGHTDIDSLIEMFLAISEGLYGFRAVAVEEQGRRRIRVVPESMRTIRLDQV